jgi:polysaccharide export outer membrane protein
MLQTETPRLPKGLVQAAAGIESIEKNYVIKPNDLLEVRLYSNKGENMIDINVPKPGAVSGTNNTQQTQQLVPTFLVGADGQARLPQIGLVRLEGYTLRQADSLLASAYNNYYVEPFVNVRFANKRVIVLGATQNRVVPLTNENMNLLEVLALSGGVTENARVRNIRLIRGDLKDPEVQLIDLSTVEGMMQANLQMRPNDIVYVEPVRRVLRESVNDIGQFTGLLGGLVGIISLVVLLRNP